MTDWYDWTYTVRFRADRVRDAMHAGDYETARRILQQIRDDADRRLQQIPLPTPAPLQSTTE